MKKFLLLFVLTTLSLSQFKVRADGEPKWFTANVQDVNTLSTLLAAQLDDAETLQSIQYLRVSGTLGSDDLTLIKSTLTGLLEIDMEGVNLTELPADLFNSYSSQNHRNLQRVVLPAGLTTIGTGAFSWCTGLQEVVVPPTLTTINQQGFYHCSSLTSFDFSSTQIAYLGTYAFSESSVAEAHFPATLKTIEERAFQYNQLTTLTFAGSLETIKTYAFDNSALLETVEVPAIGTAGSDIFAHSPNLRNVTFDEHCTFIPSTMFEVCPAIATIEIPASVEYIKSSAFSNCTGLTSVTLHEGLKTLYSYVFYGCTALTSIELPSTLCFLDLKPFYGCTNLNTMTVKSFFPPTLYSYLFNDNSQQNRTLRVPRSVMSAYKAAEGWNIFATYEAFDPEETPYYSDNISTFDEISIVVPENQPDGWKPQVNLLRGYSVISSSYFEHLYGRLRLLGEQPLSISELNLCAHEYNRRNYGSSNDSKYDCMYSQLIPRTTVTADRVNLQVYFNTYYSSSNHWHFMSFPFDINLADHNLKAQGHY